MSVNRALSSLWTWLETWMDERGGVHGYVVHHHRDNLKFLCPDTWTQATCILGSLRVYQKTHEKKWLKLTLKLSDYLVDTYLSSLHLYRNANHERKPLGKPGIIHNALPSYALCEVTKEIKGQNNWQKYHEVAKDNIVNHLLRLRDKSTGALVSIYHGKPSFIHNMNSASVLALTALAELENDSSYINKYAVKIAEHIVSCQVKGGSLSGAYPYVDKERNYRTLYSLITAIGLFKLYKNTDNIKFLKSVEALIRNLKKYVDEKTGLICHYHKIGYPQWIPDTMLFIFVSRLLENEGVKISIDLNNIINKVLERQYKNGGFHLSIGFEDLSYTKLLPSKPSIRRWRDLLPTTNWNAWNYWCLAELLPENSRIEKTYVEFPLELETDREEEEGPHKIIEEKESVIFTNQKNQQIVGVFNKTAEVADFCLIKERGDYWRTIESLNKYPSFLRRIILGLPNIR